MLSTLIALPYQLARLPLTTLDHGLSGRLPETSLPRTALDRVLGSADRRAGALLRNDDLASRGADRLERSSKLTQAARLEDQADVRREAARAAAEVGRREAAEKREAAAKRASAGLAEAKQAEERGKQQAKADAKKTAAAKKKAAAKTAAARTETVEQRKKRVAEAAEEKKTAARRKAKAELDDARASKEAAAAARADAKILDDLTEAKKQERRD